MKWRVHSLFVAIALCGGIAMPAFAQLPMGIPDLCANSPDNVDAGKTLTLSGTVTRNCLGIHGTVLLADNVTLTVTTLLVYPDGRLDTVNHPAKGTVIFADVPPTISVDPERYGTGLLGFGNIVLQGSSRLPTFVRLASEPLAGQMTLRLSQSVPTWQAGDILIVPDTRILLQSQTTLYGTYVPQFEEVTIASIAGTTVTLRAPLAFDHKGARDANGVLNFVPHVANVTRTLTFKSANPSGARGHALFTAQASVDIEGVAFLNMGRTTIDGEPDSTTFNADGSVQRIGTNQIGRYAVHFHHLRGPAGGLFVNGQRYQYRFTGNSVIGGSKWAVGVHDTHYGLVDWNVAYKNAGAAFMTEDCSESYNVFDSNIAIRGTGMGPRDSQTGRAAVGFFFRGVNNYVRNNVATGFQGDTADTSYGFKYFQQFCQGNADDANTMIPKFPGADTMNSTQVDFVDVTTLPVLQFQNNEVYGATESGLSFWWIGSYFVTPRPNVPESIYRNLKVWNVYNNGVFQYESSRVTIDGFIMRGSNCEFCRGSVGQDYLADGYTIRNSDIQGVDVGVNVSAAGGSQPQVIQDSIIRARSAAVILRTPWTSGVKAEWVPPRSTIVNNVRFDTNTRTFSMEFGVFGAANLITSDTVQVYNYNGIASDNFTVFYKEQDPSFVVPETVPNGIRPPANESGAAVLGSPEAGLTNAQNWAKYGVAIGGAVATCSTTRPEIAGFACGGLASPPPPSGSDTTPPSVRIVTPSGFVRGSVTVLATASDSAGVADVMFTLDGAALGPGDMTSPPYQFTWDTKTADDGPHTLEATARDAAGNLATASVTVNVGNNGQSPSPSQPTSLSGPLTREPGNPILPMGSPGSIDSDKTGPRVVIKESATSYKMWYEAVPGPNRATVGYATSTDGKKWTKRGTVLRPSAAWEGGSNGEISPNSILVENGVYKLWYHSYNPADSKRRIGYATSPDGINWTKYPNPVLDVSSSGHAPDDDMMVVEPRVFNMGDGTYRMYYGGMRSSQQGIGVYRLLTATSTDGIAWTKQNDVIFGPADSGFGIVRIGSQWHMWYGIANGGIGYASSPDGLVWTDGPSNPVLGLNPIAGTTDSDVVGDSVSAYVDNGEVRVLYTGGRSGSNRIEAICMATIRLDASATAAAAPEPSSSARTPF